MFQMTNAGLYGCSAFHPSPQTPGYPASARFVHMNFDPFTCVIVPSITLINIGLLSQELGNGPGLVDNYAHEALPPELEDFQGESLDPEDMFRPVRHIL